MKSNSVIVWLVFYATSDIHVLHVDTGTMYINFHAIDH